MTTYAYQVTPLARVSAGRRAGLYNFRHAHRVIPGTVVRGALGGAMIDDPGGFGATRSDAISAFHGALPGLAVSQAVPAGAGLLHQSLVSCKYQDDGCPEPGWRDLAVLTADGVRPEDWHACAADPQVPSEARYSEGRGWVVDARSTVTATRAALCGGVPIDGKLFSRQHLRRQTVLTGTIRIDDEVDPSVRDWLLGPREISLGGNRSVLGRCRWEVQPQPRPAPTPHLLADGRAVLVLRSPAILIDAMGAAAFDLGDHLTRQPGAGGVVRVWSRLETLPTWNGVAGVPRQVDLAISAGSVALLDDDWTDSALARLLDGIGVRRQEGYGEVQYVTAPTVSTGREPDDGAAAASKGDAEDPCRRLSERLPPGRRRAVLGWVTDRARDTMQRAGSLSAEDLAAEVDRVVSQGVGRGLEPDERRLVIVILRHETEAARSGDRPDHIDHLVSLGARS
ncbi:MAG: hypothetical protein R2731_05100 [Nocardioides sp.]